MYSGVDGRVCPPGAWSQWKNMCTDIRRCSVCDAPTSRSCGACLGVPADTYARLNEPQVRICLSLCASLITSRSSELYKY